MAAGLDTRWSKRTLGAVVPSARVGVKAGLFSISADTLLNRFIGVEAWSERGRGSSYVPSFLKISESSWKEQRSVENRTFVAS